MEEHIKRAEELMQDLTLHLCGKDAVTWLENFERFMRKEPSWNTIQTEVRAVADAALIELYSTLIQKPVVSFRDLFAMESSRLQQCFFNINFTDWFGSIREEVLEPRTIKCFELDHEFSDRDLIDALGGPEAAATPLSIFLGALIEHGDGSPNIFGESDETHVFYVKDSNGNLRAIAVACSNGIPKHITAHSLRSNARWNKLRRVFALA